jgi:type I restriction enzyme S subunit
VSADAQHIRKLNILLPKFGIAPEHWAIVRGILRRHVPGSAVWAFGCRATGIARRYSDLDLAVISDEPMSIDALAALKEAFADSDLPWTVDVVDWAGISDRFRRIIEHQRVVLQEGHSRKSS